MNICFIAIGGELLKGRIINTNLAKVGEMLRNAGYNLTRSLVVADNLIAIRRAIKNELRSNDIIIMTGGLGPTTDDITKKAIADYFNVAMKEDETTLNMLETFFAQRNMPLSDRNRAQASVPENCEVMLNTKGTAPGMYFKVGKKQLFALPGVPYEMIHLLENAVIPTIQKTYTWGYFQSNILRLWGIPEAYLADKIANIESKIPSNLDLSYLPRIDGIWLEMTVKGKAKSATNLSKTLTDWTNILRELLKDKIYLEGKEALESVILRLCTQENISIAVAESMTGGQIAAKLVSISGASNYFKGSVTAYATEVKTIVLNVPKELIAQKGVVSAEVAVAMAQGVRKLLGADIAIATTGYAEKNDDILPHVWTGYADASHSDSHKDDYYSDREINIQRAANGSLIFLLNKINTFIEMKTNKIITPTTTVAPSLTKILAKLKELTTGLFYMSESDYPYEVIDTSNAQVRTATLAYLDSKTAVRQTITLDTMFASQTNIYPGIDPTSLAIVQRQQALKDYIISICGAATPVYRIGANPQWEIFIAGKTIAGNYDIIIKTISIET
ncbi:MAG: CinA family nicotinamide mononucleotide deamidase-related protein [Bacteroidales bacterium]